MNNIYNIIENNKESYTSENGELDEKLNELDNNLLKKRNSQFQKYYFINRNKENHYNLSAH